MGSMMCCLDRNRNNCFNCSQGRKKHKYDFEPDITKDNLKSKMYKYDFEPEITKDDVYNIYNIKYT